MKPSSLLIYNNFNTFEWLDYNLAHQFNGGAGGENLNRPAVSEFFSASNLNLSKSNINRGTVNSSKSNTGDFSNIAGKKKLCKSAGLSGAEKKACMKNIRDTCGKKPSGFLGIKGRRKKEKQAVWSKCANDAVVTPEESAQATADALIPTREDSGLGTGAKIMIAVGAVGFIALVGFAIANKRKAQPAMMQQPVMARR